MTHSFSLKQNPLKSDKPAKIRQTLKNPKVRQPSNSNISTLKQQHFKYLKHTASFWIMGFFSLIWKPVSSKEEEREVFEKAEFYTHMHKVAQDLLEKGYNNDQGIYVSTKMKFLEKNSKDPKIVPYSKWIVGMESKVRKVGYPFLYWDITTHVDYKNLSVWKNTIKVDITVDNKPKVSGDISLCMDSTKLKASFGAPDFLESMKLELVHCREHIALRVRGVDFQKMIPRRLDLSAAMYASCLKLGSEASYDVESRRFMNPWVGGVMKTNDLIASVIYWKDSDSLIGSFVHHFGKFDWGIEMAKMISSDNYTATFGVAWKGEPDDIRKVKINHRGELNGCYERKLTSEAVVSVSGLVDLKHPFECPKVGLKLVLQPSAVIHI